MFERVEPALADPIFGLVEAFNQDPNPDKVNLTVGVYRDSNGRTPIFEAVHEAEARLLKSVTTKAYLPIAGDPAYVDVVGDLLCNDDDALAEARAQGRIAVLQTVGGTGALHIAAALVHETMPATTVHMPNPTWENHQQIFRTAGCPTGTYPYLNTCTGGLAFDDMRDALTTLPPGDAVLLHACCHNPTGVDPDPAQWESLAALLADRSLLPVVDFAYQGLGRGLTEDVSGLTILARSCPELIICSSFSKNAGLYNERVGSLILLSTSPDAGAAVLSRTKALVRATWSNPPAHGSAIVRTILTDSDLRRIWEAEVDVMRDRIGAMRRLFVDTLRVKGVRRNLDYLLAQQGMFSYSGLGAHLAQQLRKDFSVYALDSGRINVAGMTEDNMDYLCSAIAAVWGE